jgi:hypothetical protein
MKAKDRPSYARWERFSAGYGGSAQYEDAEGGKVGGDGARVVMRRVWFLRMKPRPPRWGTYEGAVKPASWQPALIIAGQEGSKPFRQFAHHRAIGVRLPPTGKTRKRAMPFLDEAASRGS